jgi:hypothetical protein
MPGPRCWRTRMSQAPPGNRVGLAATPPGGHSRQADSPWPPDDNRRKVVTDRDLDMRANRRYVRLPLCGGDAVAPRRTA